MKNLFNTLALCVICSTSFAQNINLFPDSLHMPFIYGVASGDPTDSSVVLWTAVAYDSTNATQVIHWQLASDSTFSVILKSDSVPANSYSGYAVKADITGLQPYTKYCYRFSLNGQYSVTGFTKTAPGQAADSLTFAQVSCSSLFSGYFNAYRQIANNRAVDAVIHVGDFVYATADPQERIRIPQPEPVKPRSLEEWNHCYRLYLLDPDLREARRMHPWIQIWDNHEIDTDSTLGISTKAFIDFNPVRRPSQDSTRMWRKLSYGSLADVFIVDDFQYAGNDTFASGGEKMLTDEQMYWLQNGLNSSIATWKILGISKLFSQWDLGSFTSLLPGGGFNNSWDGYPESRDSMLYFLSQHQINNPVLLSGDLHMNVVSDIALNPFDSTLYNRQTGMGGLGIEINGVSVTRGNVDESGISSSNAQTFHTFSYELNPQQQYLNMFDHGYNTVTLFADRLIARFYLCPILNITNSIILDTVLYCKAGENHWSREMQLSVVDALPAMLVSVSPNPSATGLFFINLPSDNNPLLVEVWDNLGKKCFSRQFSQGGLQELNHEPLASGIYLVSVSNSTGKRTNLKIVSQ